MRWDVDSGAVVLQVTRRPRLVEIAEGQAHGKDTEERRMVKGERVAVEVIMVVVVMLLPTLLLLGAMVAAQMAIEHIRRTWNTCRDVRKPSRGRTALAQAL
jgi:hypothetical protein